MLKKKLPNIITIKIRPSVTNNTRYIGILNFVERLSFLSRSTDVEDKINVEK